MACELILIGTLWINPCVMHVEYLEETTPIWANNKRCLVTLSNRMRALESKTSCKQVAQDWSAYLEGDDG